MGAELQFSQTRFLSSLSFCRGDHLSVSPTFYEQLLLTEVLWAAFMCLQFGFVIFWRKEMRAKAAHKMLVKVTAGVCFTNKAQCTGTHSIWHKGCVLILPIALDSTCVHTTRSYAQTFTLYTVHKKGTINLRQQNLVIKCWWNLPHFAAAPATPVTKQKEWKLKVIALLSEKKVL